VGSRTVSGDGEDYFPICHRASVQASLERWQFTHSARWPGSMNCKTYKIRTAPDTGDRIGALRMAARFFDRSAATKTFQRGMCHV
jgi:hypothetical protein